MEGVRGSIPLPPTSFGSLPLSQRAHIHGWRHSSLAAMARSGPHSRAPRANARHAASFVLVNRGVARNVMAARFQALIAITAAVRSTSSFSEKCRRASS